MSAVPGPRMREVAPGILHWQAPHPKLGFDVSSHLIRESGTVLDPMLPDGAGREWLGADLERVVLTVRHHLRSATELGVPILAHRAGLHEFEASDAAVEGFDAGDELAPGIRVLGFGRICPDDTVLHIATGPGALAFGDGIVNYGGIGHPPDRYLGDDPETVKADILEGLEPLLDADFEVLLFAHGEPITREGKRMLREFVASRR